MNKIESIMVVMDKPKHAQTALQRARELQQQSGAHLHLVAFCWLAMAEQKAVFDAHQRRAMKKSVMDQRKQWLRDQVLDAKLAAADVTVQTVWTGDIAAWVADNAGGKHDLVVKSVHHSKTLTHTPLDWALLQQCPAPLLLCSTRRRKPSNALLATLDPRHNDRRHQALNRNVMDTAQLFAGLGKGKVHCVSVVEYSQVLSDLDIIDVRKRRKEMKENVRTLLDALLGPYTIPKSRVHMPIGKVGQTVADTAAKVDADLMIVGSSARRGIGDIMLGSSAEKILARAPCDVLAVHP